MGSTEHKPHIDPSEQPLHDFIDMDVYDVAPGPAYRKLQRELTAARIDMARLEEQLEATEKHLRNVLKAYPHPHQRQAAMAFLNRTSNPAREQEES